MANSNRYEAERAMVEWFLLTRSVFQPQLSDPNAGQNRDAGADVLWITDGRAIGFQVTEYHSDEGRMPEQRGSQLRREERRLAVGDRPYVMAFVLDPIPGLVKQISKKAVKSAHANVSSFSELILLVTASRPQLPGLGAGMLLDRSLDLPRLTIATRDMLTSSSYSRAFIFNILGLGGRPAVYQWRRNSGWCRETLN